MLSAFLALATARNVTQHQNDASAQHQDDNAYDAEAQHAYDSGYDAGYNDGFTDGALSCAPLPGDVSEPAEREDI